MSTSHHKISTSSQAERPSPRPPRRWLWYAIISVLLFNGLSLLYRFLFVFNDSDKLKIAADIGNVVGWFLAVLFCIYHIWRTRRKTHTRHDVHSPQRKTQQKIPVWVGMIFFISFIERSAYLYYDIHHSTPVLEWPTILLLLRYPFLLLIIFALYRYSIPLIARIRLFLDGLLLLTALVAFSWYFMIGPIILQNHQSDIAKITTITFSLADLILCFYLFQLTFRNTEPAFLFVRRFFILGSIGIVMADIFDITHFIQNISFFPLLQSVSICLGYILIAAAVQTLQYIPPEHGPSFHKGPEEEPSHPPTFAFSFWQGILPTTGVSIVLAFMVIIWFIRDFSPLATGIYITGIALIIQIMLRQLLVLYEIFLSNRHLQQMQQELSAKNLALFNANHRLDEQSQELMTAYEQQRFANELKDQFLLSINHELRTPLTEMHGYLELLQHSQQVPDAEMHQTFLSRALNGSNELIRLVDSILDTLRSENARKTCRKEDVLLEPAIQQTLKTFDPLKREEYQIQLALPIGLTVYADPHYLHQILSNLLSNAFKYAPPQTTITIGAREMSSSSPSSSASPHIQVWVQDQGPGVAAENIPHLFTKFFRQTQHQTSAIRGTGLGLYICKQLVEAMGGQIWVESTSIPGEGCRFCFILPVAKH